MKKVLTNNEIPHVWANQLQSEARNQNRSLFFIDEVIYSYGRHFPIAKHMTSGGRDAVLFTTRSYSNTTAKHINHVWQAARHKNIIRCPHPDFILHSTNFDAWAAQAENAAQKLTTARKPEKYLNSLELIGEQVKKYNDFFNIEAPEYLRELLELKNKNEYQAIKNKRELIKIENERKEKIKAIKKHRIELKKFLSFEISRIYNSNGNDYLRYNKEQNRIETSQGVVIPYEAAKIMYLSILNNTVKIGDQLLNFEVIDNGKFSVKIGCHNITKKHLFEFGKKTF